MSNVISRTKKEEQLAAAERAIKRTIRERRRMEEGSIFGGQSTKAGSINSQSRPYSPAHSYVLSPTTPTLKWNQARDGTMDMLSNSCSIVSLPTTPQRLRSKPSPLRCQLSDAELNGRLNHGPSTTFGGTGGAYLPPVLTPRSPLSPGTARSPSQTGWVSPLDVHFIRPSTPGTGSAASSVYRFPFPEDAGKGNLLSPALATSIRRSTSSSSSAPDNNMEPNITKFSLASPKDAEGAQPLAEWGAATGKKYLEPVRVSATFSPFPYTSQSRPQESRSNFSSGGVDNSTASRGNPKKLPQHTQPSPITPTPLELYPLPSELGDDSASSEENDAGVIRHSVVSKRTVSVHPALHSPRLDSLPLSLSSADAQARAQRRLSATSVHSTRTSILVQSESDGRYSRTSSYSTDYPRDTEMNEIHQPIPQAPTYLTTAQFSDSFRVEDDNIFRDSPFSNAHQISSHSPTISATSNLTIPRKHEQASPFVLELNLPDGSSSFSGPGRDSIGDFYDTYYRQSMATYSNEGNSGSSQKPDVGNLLATNGSPRKPPPSKFEGGLGRDAITEVASPVGSTWFKSHDEMPNMI